jgi:hypothetical protein
VVVGGAVVDVVVTSSMAGTDLAGEGPTTSAASSPRLTAAATTVAMTSRRFMATMLPGDRETRMSAA